MNNQPAAQNLKKLVANEGEKGLRQTNCLKVTLEFFARKLYVELSLN